MFTVDNFEIYSFAAEFLNILDIRKLSGNTGTAMFDWAALWSSKLTLTLLTQHFPNLDSTFILLTTQHLTDRAKRLYSRVALFRSLFSALQVLLHEYELASHL